jgi:tetratricopeptide (TPR) repeat protein
LAKQAVALDPKGHLALNTLGVAQYRAGDYQAAMETLSKAMELLPGGTVTDWYFLAMAHWQLGHKAEARKWYDKAVQWTQEHSPNDQALLRFRAEAEELLGIKDKPPTAKEPAGPWHRRNHGSMMMIANDQELGVTLDRIAKFQRQVSHLRTVETSPGNYHASVSGFLAEIDRMQLEVREYLSLHPAELAKSDA